MTAREAAELACKVLGVYVWVRGLGTIPFLLVNPNWSVVAVAIPFGLAFAVAGWGVFHGWRLLPPDDPQADEAGRGAARVRVAFSVLGLWLVVQHLPQLATDSWMIVQDSSSSFGWPSLAADGFAVAIGLGLFLQVPGLGWTYRRALAPGQTPEQLALPAASSDPIQVLAFAVLGFYFLVWGGVGVFDNGIQIVTHLDELRESEAWSQAWMVRFALRDALLLFFGLAVFLRSRRTSEIWHRLQGAAPRT